MRFLPLILSIALILPSIAPDPTAAQVDSADPCRHRDLANHIKRVFAKKEGPGVDMYLLFGDEKSRMISTFGVLTVTINGSKVIDSKPIDCKDFRFFKLVRGDEVLGIVLDWIPQAKFGGLREKNFACARLWTTYAMPKEECDTFYAL